MLERGISLISIKSIDDEQRVIRGIASTPTMDYQGDVVDPLGVKFKNPLPFLLHHDQASPVGEVTFDKPTKSGIGFTARIPKVVEPGRVKDRTDEAWHSAKYGLLRGASIGWMPIETTPLANGARLLKSINVVELSMVAVPANSQATITSIKSLDAPHLAASGTRSDITSPPGVSGSPQKAARTMTPTPISEQIANEQAELQTKSARLEALMAEEEAGTIDEAGISERDTLTKALGEMTSKIERLSALEAAQAVQAKGVTGVSRGSSAPAAPTVNPRIEVKALPKGTLFTRYAMAVAAGKGSYSDTLAYARRFANTPEVQAYIKAVAGTTDGASPGWGAELYNPNAMVTEFVELIRARSIIGRVPADTDFRRVPAGIPVITQTGGSTFAWVGEGASKPVGQLAFDRTTTERHKVAGIVVASEELIRYGKPDAETTIRRDLTDGCALFLDEAFIQVAKTAGANNPASITNGVSAPNASGATLAAFLTDFNTALATFDVTGSDGLVIAMTPALARGLSMMTNALGQTPTGFNLTPNGGTLFGYPVLVSNAVDSGTIVIFKPSEILISGGESLRLDSSNQATLDMDGGSPATATFGLWQNNCVGIRCEQYITWQKRRSSGVVAIIDTASYHP
jgi:HK97 family phage major capsid protein